MARYGGRRFEGWRGWELDIDENTTRYFEKVKEFDYVGVITSKKNEQWK